MNCKKIIFIITCIAALSCTLLFAYEVNWWTIDCGGETSSGGNYTLAGTIGQHDAAVMSSGQYSLTGGFWNDSMRQQTFAECWYLY